MNKKNHLGWNMRSRDLFAKAFLKAGGDLYMLGCLLGIKKMANLTKRYGYLAVDVDVIYSEKEQTPEEMRDVLRVLIRGTQEAVDIMAKARRQIIPSEGSEPGARFEAATFRIAEAV